MEKITGRKVKSKLKEILVKEIWKEEGEKLILQPGVPALEALFANLYSTDDLIKWRSVTLLGILAEKIFSGDKEKVRIIMRRCIWMLTEESGGIAWGVPEAMGETAARIPEMADEYTHLITAYAHEVEGPDNFLEHEPLRKGVIWALMRISQAKPDLIKKHKQVILQRMKDEDLPEIKAMLCISAKNAGIEESSFFLEEYQSIDKDVQLYLDENIGTYNLSNLSLEALEHLNKNK